MPQAGVSVSPGRTYRGDEDQETADGLHLAPRRQSDPRSGRAVAARLASMADVTSELEFAPRPRPRRVSGPAAPRRRADAVSSSPPRPVRADAPERADQAAEAAYRTAEPAYRVQEADYRPAEPPVPVPGAGVTGRRTVTIQGRGAERYTPTTQRRRPTRRPHEREGFRPDRVAMWAVMLGFVLVLVAATSSHAAAISHRAGAAHRAPAAHRQTALVEHAVTRHASAHVVALRAR